MSKDDAKNTMRNCDLLLCIYEFYKYNAMIFFLSKYKKRINTYQKSKERL